MREQADLSGAEAFAEKAEKGRFVYEALRAQAEASQAPLRARLEAAGVAFRSFYLVNMIEVEGDRALAGELAAREDVSSIARKPRSPSRAAARDRSGDRCLASRLTPHALRRVSGGAEPHAGRRAERLGARLHGPGDRCRDRRTRESRGSTRP